MPWPARETGNIALATAAMAALLWFLPNHVGWLWLLIHLAGGGLMYAAILWCLNIAGFHVR